MCGLVGFIDVAAPAEGLAKENLRRMSDAIIYRGPDDAGYWYVPSDRIGLGHRRLSIVDLSPAGHQPMESGSGRFVIAFNGEIYNHNDLRDRLEQAGAGVQWRGHSDTETLLAGFDFWGIEKTIQYTVGMFAFAVWDRSNKLLILGRDRLGEKPLYYGWQGTGANSVFLFGSELKSLEAHPCFRNEINRDALALHLRHNYVPSPYSIYQGISKLPPGTLLHVSLTNRDSRPTAYWSGKSAALKSIESPFTGSIDEAVDRLDSLLKQAIDQQMLADVPVGASLSGGIDSSTIVALMQSMSSRPVKTFSIGFDQSEYDEATHAKAVAKFLGTEHTEFYVSAPQVLSVAEKMPALYDEPFADPSQIPTFLLSKMTANEVTVSLSGDAGDELFCGYERYFITERIWSALNRFPLPVRKLAGNVLELIPSRGWDLIGGAVASGLSRPVGMANPGDKFRRALGLVCNATVDELYRNLNSHWLNPEAVVLGSREPATVFSGTALDFAGMNNQQRMMVRDMLCYLPDDILVKVDRAAMANSLETRVPFLDHRVVEFAWQLPHEFKVRNNKSKWILRQVLDRYVPASLIDRPKKGFSVPIGEWLRGPLKDWAENLLCEDRLRTEGFFDPAPIRKKWAEHLSGRQSCARQLWTILMFQAWMERPR